MSYPTPPPQPPMTGMYLPQVPRPKQVELSFRIWLAAIVVNLIGAIYVMVAVVPAMQNQMLGRIPTRGGLGDPGLVQGSVRFGMITGIVFAVIMVGIWLLFVFKMRAGRNWARITLTVFTGLWLLSLVFSLLILTALPSALMPIHYPPMTFIPTAVVVVLAIAAVIPMYLAPARPYFARRY